MLLSRSRLVYGCPDGTASPHLPAYQILNIENNIHARTQFILLITALNRNVVEISPKLRKFWRNIQNFTEKVPITNFAVCEVFRKKNMVTCYHDNMITLSCYHVIMITLSCYHVIMLTLSCYHVIMIALSCYHVIMITLSCYHVIMITLSCYHDNVVMLSW
jgi:hypothetical protein